MNSAVKEDRTKAFRTLHGRNETRRKWIQLRIYLKLMPGPALELVN